MSFGKKWEVKIERCLILENKKYEQILYIGSIIVGTIITLLGIKLYPMTVLLGVFGSVLLIFGLINIIKLYIIERK